MSEALLYPIFLKLQHQPTLIVGGGKVASRKIQDLLNCEARVHVVSPEVEPEIARLVEEQKITWEQRPFAPEDVEGKAIVFAATANAAVNETVRQAAQEQKILINVVDTPHLCDFFVPSVLRRGTLTVAISTGGSSPAFAALFARRLVKYIPPYLASYMDLLKEIRQEVKALYPDDPKRRHAAFLNALHSNAEDTLSSGNTEKARAILKQAIHLPIKKVPPSSEGHGSSK